MSGVSGVGLGSFGAEIKGSLLFPGVFPGKVVGAELRGAVSEGDAGAVSGCSGELLLSGAVSSAGDAGVEVGSLGVGSEEGSGVDSLGVGVEFVVSLSGANSSGGVAGSGVSGCQ